jgi:hypothetical protein
VAVSGLFFLFEAELPCETALRVVFFAVVVFTFLGFFGLAFCSFL